MAFMGFGDKVSTEKIEEVIREFQRDNFGLDDVDPYSEFAEWVPALAEKIAQALETGSPYDDCAKTMVNDFLLHPDGKHYCVKQVEHDNKHLCEPYCGEEW